VAVLLLAAFGLGWKARRASEAERAEGVPVGAPHIVLLILDTLRADRVGAYDEGLPEGVSSELDGLAARGVRFARAISQSSWTRPSIGSMLTSQYPRSLGIYTERGDALADRFTTLAESLHAAGYRTIGLTANPNLNRAFNFDQGFDVYVDSSVVWDWMELSPGQVTQRNASLPSAPDLFQRALELAQRSPSAPTYLQINLMEVHEHTGRAPLLRPEYRDDFPGRPDARYLQCVRQLSDDVGAFVEALSSLDGWRNTIFVIASDHGEGLDSHPHVAQSRFHGRLVYDSQNWVPLIFYSPSGALPRGQTVDRPVRLLDLVPTLLDYAGARPPEDAEGMSLRPLIDDPDASVALPEFFVVETEFRGAKKIGVYGSRLKFIDNIVPQRGAERLETQENFIDEDGSRTDVGEEERDERARMRRYLEAWMASHPRAPRWEAPSGPTEDEVNQLRAIGYAQ